MKNQLKGGTLFPYGKRFLLLFMKAYLLFFCTLAMGMNSSKVLSQKSIIVERDQKLTIDQVFDLIMEQTDYNFIYQVDLFKDKPKVELKKGKIKVNRLLEQSLMSASVVMEVTDSNTIVIKPKKTNNNIRQDLLIRGKVNDGEGVPLPGANIIEKGTDNGTQSDFDGNFAITVSDANAILVVSYLGFTTKEIPLEGKTDIAVQLLENAAGLDEVVVVGYGTQKKVNLTGAVTSVKAQELNQIPTNNLSNTLAGRAPGVNITNTSGLSGASSSIRMRGSFGEPLYVIDGIVRDKDAFDALNANEVDQLTFLKDAATASIYGSRAGNGVVLVTTKTGSENEKPIFSFQTTYASAMPTQQLLSDKTTATDELIYQNRVAEFLGTAPPNGETEFEYFKNRSYNVNDMIWQNPSSLDYTMSINGGSKALTYYALGSYRKEEGSFKGLDYAKYNLRSNMSAKLSNSITLDLNLAASQQNHNRFYCKRILMFTNLIICIIT